MSMGIYTTSDHHKMMRAAYLWERLLAAIGREAAIKPVPSVCQENLGLKFYDGFAADRAVRRPG